MPAGRSICLPHHSLLSLLCPHRNDIYKKSKSINNTEVKCIFYAFNISFSYLFADRPHHRHGEWADVAPTQVFALPLVTEELQLSLLLIIQTVTVAHLDEDHMTMKPREHELERWQKMDGWMNEYYLKWIEVVFFKDFNICIMLARSVTDPRVELTVIMFLSLLRKADIVLCFCWVQIVNQD